MYERSLIWRGHDLPKASTYEERRMLGLTLFPLGDPEYSQTRRTVNLTSFGGRYLGNTCQVDCRDLMPSLLLMGCLRHRCWLNRSVDASLLLVRRRWRSLCRWSWKSPVVFETSERLFRGYLGFLYEEKVVWCQRGVGTSDKLWMVTGNLGNVWSVLLMLLRVVRCQGGWLNDGEGFGGRRLLSMRGAERGRFGSNQFIVKGYLS